MLEKEFVPYEQALKLKELGFDNETLAYYPNKNRNLIIKESFGNISGCYKYRVTAPLYQQAFRWLYQKYKIYHEIYLGHDEDKLWWNYYIYKIKLGYKYESMNDNDENSSDTYEEAELECLNKLIELCEKKH